MKQLIGLFLLLCLLLPSAGTYVWLSFHKIQLKKEIKHKIIANIDLDELVLLQFSREDAEKKLEWEHSKEFEYEGYMYDVVKTEVINDSISYWCWLDYKETKLNKKLNKILIGALEEDTESKEKHTRLTYFHQQLFYQNKPFWQIGFSGKYLQKDPMQYATVYYQSISIPPLTNPPRLS